MTLRAIAFAGVLCIGFATVAGGCSVIGGLNGLQEVECLSDCAEAGVVVPQGDATTPGEGSDAQGASDAASTIDGETGLPSDPEASDNDGGVSDTGTDAGPPDANDGSVPLNDLGCFADGQTRDIAYLAYDDSADSPARCVATCAQGGYAYAATQNGTQCYCGNAYGGQGPSGGCVVACGGDASSICGGQFANSVYAISPTPVPTPAFEGCFNDNNSIRDLPDQVYSSSFNTTAACVTACTYHGFLYAGTQDVNQCFCGNAYGQYGSSSSCTYLCSGDASEVCGGSSKNSVYRTRVLDAGIADAKAD